MLDTIAEPFMTTDHLKKKAADTTGILSLSFDICRRITMKKQTYLSRVILIVFVCCFTCFSCNQSVSTEDNLPINHYYAQTTFYTFPDVLTLNVNPNVYSATKEDGNIYFYGSDSKEMLNFASGIESYPDKTLVPFVEAFYESTPIRFIGLAEQPITLENDKAYDYYLISYDTNNSKSTIYLSTEFSAMSQCFYKDNLFVAIYMDKVDIFKVDFANSSQELLSSYSYAGCNLNTCISDQSVVLTYEDDSTTYIIEYNTVENTYKTGTLSYTNISSISCAPTTSNSIYCIMTQNLLIGINSDFSAVEQFLDIKNFSVLQNILNGEKIFNVLFDGTSIYITTSGNYIYIFDELTGEALQAHKDIPKSGQTLSVLMHKNDGYITNMSSMYPYADVSIEIYEAPHAEFANYLSTSLLSGSADWDIISITSPYLPLHNYIDEGHIYSLDDYISSLSSDEWYTDIFDFCKYNSHNYIFPVGITLDVLIRNDGTETSASCNFDTFIFDCTRMIENNEIPITNNKFSTKISVPLKPLVAALENNWNGDVDLLLTDVFSVNQKLNNELFYGTTGNYTYMLSAGPYELNQAGSSVMTTPVYDYLDMNIGGSAVVQLGFAVLENSQAKNYAQDYLAFLSKYLTSSISPYKNAFTYDYPSTIEALLSSTSGTQLYTSELASQIIEINNRYLNGNLTLDEAVQSAKDKIWIALGE